MGWESTEMSHLYAQREKVTQGNPACRDMAIVPDPELNWARLSIGGS